jgi:ATP-dependent helicase/DNAse subunit B
MPLTLVTGPANAAKAGSVMDAFREALERAAGGRLAAPEPLLVVPTAADVEPYQRELAAGGAVFGGEVVTFGGLIREAAWRTGCTPRVIGALARERVVAAAVREARLELLAASAQMPGFAAAAGRLFAELQRALVTPARLRVAVRAAQTPRHGEEVAALYSAYVRRLEALGRVDEEGRAWRVLDALRADPAAWGGRPVFLYGFDDLTPLQLDALETLVRVVEVDVTVSLPYERGRAAFAGRAATVEALRPLAEAGGRVVELPDRSEHYHGPGARAALHHLERHLFEPSAPVVSPNGAVRLLEAGGERAEAELAAAAVLELLRDGVAPGDVAVLVPRREEAALLEQVLEDFGIAVERDGRVPLRHARLGAGLLAFARCGVGEGDAADLVTWLRTPGKLRRPELADELEARVRRAAVTEARAARALWEELAGTPLHELDGLAGAAREGLEPFLAALQAELERMWTAPHRRRAGVLQAADATDARLAAAVRAAAQELRELAAAGLATTPAEALAALADLEVRAASGTPGGVLVAEPAAVRARRFRAVLLLGLQDGAFPARPAPEPFLSDDDRREIARAGGLVLPLHEDVLARERYLFYTSVARAEEVLYLSFRTTDEEGEPQLPSPFVDDVRSLFADELWQERGRRLLAEVTWPPAQAPTPLELRRSQAARTPGAEPEPLPSPRRPLPVPEVVSATDLERFAACGVRWLVESILRPRRLEPDSEPMKRGSLAHDLLRDLLARLDAPLSPATYERAAAELRRVIDAVRVSGAPARAALRALEADLFRWLRAECDADTGMRPERLEWSFGRDGDDAPPLEFEGLRVTGRIDRVDVGPGGVAVIRDYKNSTGYPAARWVEDDRLQGALYAEAVRQLLGREPVGAVYQPLGGPDLRARGAVEEGSALAAGAVGKDVLAVGEFEALMAELRGRAVEVAGQMREGRVGACPERCTPRGCAYPGICRARETEA